MRRWRSECASWLAVVVVAAAGCKSDFNQQILERELRLQEDQIYQLQDTLQNTCVRLDHVAAENQSLKKQLGIADVTESRPGRSGPTPSPSGTRAAPAPGAPALAPPVLVPPTVEDLPPPPRSSAPPGGSRFGSPDEPPPAFRGTSAPAPVDGLPLLPEETVIPPGGIDAAETTPTGSAARPRSEVRRLSHEQAAAGGSSVTHLVLNPEGTSCADADGDGASDAMTIVFEPRDAEGRLVATMGDVSIAIYEPLTAATAADPSGEGACIARWEIPAAEAAASFRRTSRYRGLQIVKPWPGQRPMADHVRVFVRMRTFEGETFETQGTVPVRVAAIPR
ncbi:MAG: hypothetical protein ACKOEX_12105 [Planctomycetia bacterium]